MRKALGGLRGGGLKKGLAAWVDFVEPRVPRLAARRDPEHGLARERLRVLSRLHKVHPRGEALLEPAAAQPAQRLAHEAQLLDELGPPAEAVPQGAALAAERVVHLLRLRGARLDVRHPRAHRARLRS